MAEISPPKPGLLKQYQSKALQLLRRFEDLAVPFRLPRWIGVFVLLGLYFVRVYLLGGYYIVTYGMCIHILYLLALMVTPVSDPDHDEGVSLGAAADGEFKPFVPKVQEFKIWRNIVRVISLCFFLTFFSIFDIPAYWPILVLYFLILFISTFWERVKHMITHKYVPWQQGKPKYVPKEDK